MLLSWLASRLISWVFGRLRAGDVRPTVLLDRRDVVMTFPGESSWSGVIRGRDAHRAWLKRLVDVGLQNYPDEVLAVGPPWHTTICVRGHDFARDVDGTVVYENRYVLWGRLRWGRLAEYEVYEDTEKVAGLDRLLSGNRLAAG